jgi:succinyl-CoA synthetase beta subunit
MREGNIGVLSNGAALAMATMDCLKYHGGSPANFLDMGGTASPEQLIEAIKLLENDERIDSIIFNIFGSMADCNIIASCILSAAEDIQSTKPIVLLLKGRNSESAKKMIESRGEELGVYFCDEMDAAAEMVVQLAESERKKKTSLKELKVVAGLNKL